MAAETEEKKKVAKVEKVRLVPVMIAKAGQVLDVLFPEQIDIEFVKHFEGLLGEDGSKIENLEQLPELAAKFIYAHDLCKDSASVCSALEAEAKLRMKKENALAFLERSTNYFTQTDTKPTDKGKEAYAAIDEKYLKIADLHARWSVLADYFEKSRLSFENKHNWIKKLYDVTKASMPFEGKPRSGE